MLVAPACAGEFRKCSALWRLGKPAELDGAALPLASRTHTTSWPHRCATIFGTGLVCLIDQFCGGDHRSSWLDDAFSVRRRSARFPCGNESSKIVGARGLAGEAVRGAL